MDEFVKKTREKPLKVMAKAFSYFFGRLHKKTFK